MIIVLKPRISKPETLAVLKEIRKLGYIPRVMTRRSRTVISAVGD
jgi:DNA-binding LacI/PurR family transcriptional regulator